MPILLWRKHRKSDNESYRGSDLKYNAHITLEEAYKGVKRKIKFTALCKCKSCNGYGSSNNSSKQSCTRCHGSGKERYRQGFFMIEKVCSYCKGKGKIIKNPCDKCLGQGRITKSKEIVVDIPAGVERGARIRLLNEGEAGVQGAPSGHLYICIEIKKHQFYERHQHDLFCCIPIKMVTAMIGGTIEVPTLDGKVSKINIPPGTQPGTKLRLRNKGMPIVKSCNNYGDLYLEANVELPIKISKQQVELIKEFDSFSQVGANPKADNFFIRMKNFIKDIRK